MLNSKINLTKLEKVAIVKGKRGQDLLVIDIAGSHLFKSEQNNVFLDIVQYETPDSDYGDYAIKQSLPKEVREADKENEVQRPFLGNTKIYVKKEDQVQEVNSSDVFNDDDNEAPF